MPVHAIFAFAGVAAEIFAVAWITFGVLVAALLAAAAGHFFRICEHFDDDVRELTMDLSPAERRRFFAFYAANRPKNPAVAWFLAVLLGPIGANLYRGERAALFGAVVSLNGLGAWWLESWFSTPHLVTMKNRALADLALEVVRRESIALAGEATSETNAAPVLTGVS